MQFSHPLFGTEYPHSPNFIPHCPCNNSGPYPTIYPELIGEGDVASVLFPDGSVHFYFMPTNKHSHGFQWKTNAPNYCPYFNNEPGAYYIKSISNPMSPTAFVQQYQNIFGIAAYRPSYSKPYPFSDYNSVPDTSGFQLKFHNDRWTSTTDLQYFFPLCTSDRLPATPLKVSTTTQANTFSEDFNCRQSVCTKPCLCYRENVKAKSPDVEMANNYFWDKPDSNRNSSATTISSSRKKTSNTRIRKSKLNLKGRKHKKVKNKRSCVDCECHKPNTTDKAVTTYTDQASCCTAEDRNTQCPSNSAATTSDEKEYRGDFKALSTDKRKMEIKSSEKLVGFYLTGCSSESCCCSTTDTEGRDV